MSTAATETGPAGLRRLIVSVESLDEALTFYRDVLGLRIERGTAEFVWLSTSDGTEIVLHQRPAQPSDAGVAVGFTVQHLASVVARWQDLGGVIIDPPEVQPWGEPMAVVRDRDGHVVCISGSLD